MAEDSDHGPHYIPELDPDNPKSGPKVRQRMLWLMFIGGSVCTLSGVGVFLAGFERIGLVLGGIGLVLLAPFLIMFGF